MNEFIADFEFQSFIRDAVTTVIIVVVASLIWMLVSRSLRVLEKRPSVSKTLLLPLRLAARYGITLVAFLLILSAYGIPIGNFWTLVSTVVGLIAIGFVAVWSVLSNISATFLLLILQPFRVGDYVRIVGEDVMGDVVDIDFMFTTVRSRGGDVFKVPNNQFFQKSTLQPADPEKLERDIAAKVGVPESDANPHKDQNLEGLKMPSVGKGPR